MEKGDTICVSWADVTTQRNEYAIGLIYEPIDKSENVWVLLRKHSNKEAKFKKWLCVRAGIRINPTFVPTRMVLIEKHLKYLK